MQLEELLYQKLRSFKSRLILWAQELNDEDIKIWSEAWLNTAMAPIPDWEPKSGFSPFFVALTAYRAAEKQLKDQQFKEALDMLFGLESMFGHQKGLKAADRRTAAKKAKKRHAETIDDKRLALTFYIENDLSSISNQKAAEVLAKQFPLKVRTLKGYISDFKRYRDVMTSSASPSAKIASKLYEIAAGLECVISTTPDKQADAIPLLEQAKEAIKAIEVRMIDSFVTETIEEAQAFSEMGEEFYKTEQSKRLAILQGITAEIWSDPSEALRPQLDGKEES